ncbi:MULTISPECIES: flagellin domain-containing protein [Pseudomonas]|uniref:flagellin domain-containing protein n=1 Tax=Pseudomonas TaxID=286 RepID=UPI000BA3EAA9|nr:MULTISPECIES: flagellin domain-containing protein [Pseudomonas]MCU1723868.1 flagellin domain-containing protein [Pseudomonas sp. 5P_5.1_Bac1]MCU1735164.1 flagellin domain-containing protein [Pseudomonas sp. 20P_3.2_Bac4]MCU1744512.1 flagellin domain-containing protein [Pseudomonas sp. 20P_3.2_Bac5]
MALTVNTNTTSLAVQKNLNRASDSLSTSMTRLSSGLRINSAKDDAAGQQIANKLQTMVTGSAVAIKNANDGVSITQTAEGALSEMTNILQRMRELALQSRNDSNGTTERAALNKEFAAKSDEITRIASSTTYGTSKHLLDASAGTMQFQVGAMTGTDQVISVVMSTSFAASTLAVGTGTLAISGTSDSAVHTSVDAAITAIDAALQKIDDKKSELGAVQNRFQSTINNLQSMAENATAAQGRVQDTDFAAETAQLTKQQTLQQASTAVLAQANQLPSAVLKLLQ